MSKKELCEEIYTFAIKHNPCELIYIFKRFIDKEDYNEALLMANGQKDWLIWFGLSKNLMDDVINFCGGVDRYKLYYKNGELFVDRKSRYEYKKWNKKGKLINDIKCHKQMI